MATEFSYPLDFEQYTPAELADLIGFLDDVEAYTKGRGHIDEKRLIEQYATFKNILNNNAEEKRIDREFKRLTGISIYKTMRKITQ